MDADTPDAQRLPLFYPPIACVASVALLVASRLPLTSSGVGSSVATIDLLGMAGSLGIRSLQIGSVVVTFVLTAGIGLGAACLVPARIGRYIWCVFAVVVLAAGATTVGLLGTNAGPAPWLVLFAGAGLCLTGAWERRWRARRRTQSA